jgi:hypothetical protein
LEDIFWPHTAARDANGDIVGQVFDGTNFIAAKWSLVP